MKHIIIVIILLSAVKLIYSQNTVLNPGFESNFDYWMYASDYPVVTDFSIDNSTVHSGLASAKITVTDSSSNTAIIAQNLTVTEHKHYEFNFWIKTDNIEQYVLPYTKFLDDTVLVFENFYCPSGNVNAWTKIQSRFTAPAGTDNLNLFIFMLGKGTMWLDDFMFTEISENSSSGFHVNIAEETGVFNHLFSANGPGPVNESHANNYIDKFQAMGIEYVRTHDYQYSFDHSIIFPDTTKDPLNPDAYDFTSTDTCVENIINAGGKVFYRFGESAHYPPDGHTPADKDKWAQVCVQILKHYNDSWNNGYNYEIEYAEIWNEPDLPDFWSGDVQEYIALYRIAANKIKTYDPDIKVGGPAVSNPYDQSFMDVFLDSVSTYNLPADFISYHLYYHPNPYYFLYTNEMVREKTDAYGLTDIELINTEWNSYMFNFELQWEYGMFDALNAATIASALHYMQQSTIGKLFRYAFINPWFGLISMDDEWYKPGLAMRSAYEVMHANKQLEATGSDRLGKTITAARDTATQQIKIMIADNASADTAYHLFVDNIETNVSYDYEIYRIDSLHAHNLVSSGSVNSAHPDITQHVNPPYVDLIIMDKIVSEPDKNMQQHNIAVYPNPADDYLTIHSIDNSPVGIKICTQNGQVLIAFDDITHKKINTAQFSSGTYIVNVYQNHSLKESRKIVISDN
ncbi:MAG: T9SS type A sorting domain-containing protein [Bacteroidota bacterium]|nr:T9SS type A sorting domain-containing protein [Bacteroidota bacterium]